MAGLVSDRGVTVPRDMAVRVADRALQRMAGAPLIHGNAVQLLRDAAENYPAWMEAMRGAKKEICFETYSFRADATGMEFARLLERKAREGVRVRLIYDWFGGLGAASFLFWRRLRKAGV